MDSIDLKAWRYRWKMYNDFQREEQTKFLRRLTPQQGVSMFFELHAFAEQFVPKGQRHDPRWDSQRIHNLARIHALFTLADP